MIMTSTSLYQQHDSLREEARAEPDGGAAALHERLVAYVNALTGPHELRTGVWVEHSYARARGATAPPAAHVRVLLAPAPDEWPAPPALVDVCGSSPPRPDPPPDHCESDGDDDDLSGDDDVDEDEVRARLKALAPSATHARLAHSALDTLRRLRLARLAGGRRARPEAARAAARRLRLALAAVSERGAAPWLHGALLTNLPRSTRTLYEKALAALRCSAPRLADRLTGVRIRAAVHVSEAVADGAVPWLVWLCGVRPGLEARWARRLGAVLHVVCATVGSPAAAAPEAWCAALAGGARAALADALAEAGERAVVVGGAGACAALSAALCAAPAAGTRARVAGLLLLAPPLLTAEGVRDAADDPLAEVRVPTLVVAGTGAAASWRGAAREACRTRGAVARRLLEVRGADDALRVPRAVRERLRLPQRALDAAIAEECARWAAETADGALADSPPRDRDHERERPRERPRRRGGASPAPRAPDEEYAHLPPARPATPDTALVRASASACASERPPEPAAAGAAEAAGGARRVVSRGAGGTPLALLPPRRVAAGAPAPPLRAADIMQLPIVFADDEPAAPPAAVTVTSGARGGRYTRVIVAKRGAGRPVLLRRGVRFMTRSADADTAG